MITTTSSQNDYQVFDKRTMWQKVQIQFKVNYSLHQQFKHNFSIINIERTPLHHIIGLCSMHLTSINTQLNLIYHKQSEGEQKGNYRKSIREINWKGRKQLSFTQKWVKVMISSLFLHLTRWATSIFPTGTFSCFFTFSSHFIYLSYMQITFNLLKLQTLAK